MNLQLWWCCDIISLNKFSMMVLGHYDRRFPFTRCQLTNRKHFVGVSFGDRMGLK
jgi:hypothetical protein